MSHVFHRNPAPVYLYDVVINGLLCYLMGGTIDGQRGDHVLLAPPYILTAAQLDEKLEKLARGLDAVFHEHFPLG